MKVGSVVIEDDYRDGLTAHSHQSYSQPGGNDDDTEHDDDQADDGGDKSVALRISSNPVVCLERVLHNLRIGRFSCSRSLTQQIVLSRIHTLAHANVRVKCNEEEVARV